MRLIPLIPILALAACGTTTVTRSVTTTTSVPTTINGVEVTPDNIFDLADIDADQVIVDGVVVTPPEDGTGSDTETPAAQTPAEETTDTAAASSDVLTAPDTATALQYGNLAVDDFDRILGDGVSNGIPGTAFNQIPEAGSASFVGPALVSIFERVVTVEGSTTNTVDTETVAIVGTSTVDFDFGSGEFTGTVDDMFAIDSETFATDLVDGVLSVNNGVQANPEGRPTVLAADAVGSLTAFEQTYDIDVDLNGLLRGTNPGADIPIKALSLEGLDGTIAGSSLLVNVGIVGDRDAATTGAFVNR